MEPWGTPALTGYSFEDFPSRTTWRCLLVRKEKKRSNMWPKNPQDLSLWKRPTYQTLPKALDRSSATAWLPPDLLKVLATLLDTTVRRSAVDREDLNAYWKSEKEHISLIILLFTSFSKTLLITERRLTDG